MSETVSANDPQTVASPEAVTAKSSGKGLALLALLIGLGAAGAAGWGVWQIRQLPTAASVQAPIDKLAEQLVRQAETDQALRGHLAQMTPLSALAEQASLLAQLQGEQQQLGQRLTQVMGASRQGWRMAEAEYLLRLASLRLVALQDIHSALGLVQGAGEILREQNDPDAFAAREQVAKVLQALRSTKQPDPSELFIQLAALREQVAVLQPLSPAFVETASTLPELPADAGWRERLQRLGERLSAYFRIQLDVGEDIRPLLAGEQLAQVRLTLSLALEQAQWGALNGNQAVYGKAIEQAQKILLAYFKRENPQSQGLSVSLEQLATQPVRVAVPDLAPALMAVQAYNLRRQALQDQLLPLEAPVEEAQP